MKNFFSALIRLTTLAAGLKLIGWILVLSVFDLEGFLITTPAIILLLIYLTYKFYYLQTEENNKMIRSVALVALSSIISFVLILLVAMSMMAGYHG